MRISKRLTGFGIMVLLALCVLCFPANAGSISLEKDGAVIIDYLQQYVPYDGTAKRPVIDKVQFYKGNKFDLDPVILMEGRDYVISYVDNVNPGTGWIYLTGIGDYCDTESGFFRIYRPSPVKGKAVLSKPGPAGVRSVRINVKLNTDEYEYNCMILLRSKSPSGPFEVYDNLRDVSRWSNSYAEGEFQRAIWYLADEYTGEYMIEAKAEEYSAWYYKLVVVEGGIGYDTNTVYARAGIPAPEIGNAYASPNLKKACLTWNKVKGSSGYEVYRKDTSTWEKVKTTGSKKSSCTDKKIKPGREYRYKVRAFRTDKGKTFYSDFSKEVVVRAKASKVKGDYKKGASYGNSASRLKELRQAVQGFMTNYIRSGMQTWEKVEQAYLFIRRVCAYGTKNGFNSAWGAIVNRSATCYGYSKALKALCDAMRIPCRFVRANRRAFNPSHAWNMVKVEGKWYIVDVQGGFFLLSGKDYMGATGMNWNKKQYPACSSTSHREAYASSPE